MFHDDRPPCRHPRRLRRQPHHRGLAIVSKIRGIIKEVLAEGFTIEELRAMLLQIGGDENSNLDVRDAHIQLRRLRKAREEATR